MAWREATDPDNPQNTAAGGASDMVKHTVELAWLDQLLDHPPWRDGLRLRECHAGRGLYRLDDEPRRRRLRRLLASDLPLARAQREGLDALRLAQDGSCYLGSSLLYARRLRRETAHRYHGYEWWPATREVLRGALAESCPDLAWEVPGEGRFDGETFIAEELAGWGLTDVISLDPFALWQRPKLATRRARYRRLVTAYEGLGDQAPPMSWFFVWPSDVAARRDRARGSVTDGYRDLWASLAHRRPIVVHWCWELSCAMWLLVPPSLRAATKARVEGDLQALLHTLGGEAIEERVQLTVD